MFKKTTNRDQFRELVNAMKLNPDIAKNDCKRPPEEVRQFWDDLRHKLNSLAPPTKEVSEWKKVWSDHKSNLKKKLSAKKKEIKGTGGGPNKIVTFTADEEEVFELIQLRESAEGIQNVSIFGIPTNTLRIDPECQHSKKRPRSDEIILEEAIFEDEEFLDNPEPASSTSNVRQKAKCTDPKVLLERQINMQEEFYKEVKSAIYEQKENAKELNNNIKKVYRSIDRIHDQKKIQIKENIRHHKEIERIAREKLRVKQQQLELDLERKAADLKCLNND